MKYFTDRSKVNWCPVIVSILNWIGRSRGGNQTTFQGGTSFVDIFVFTVLCLLCLCVRLFICALWSPTGKGLTSWLSFVVSNCEFVTFPLARGQVWYSIVSIPDLCTLTYFRNLYFIKLPSDVFWQPMV